MSGTNANTHTPETSGLVLHHLELSRSNRILFLLEELKIRYEVKVYQRDGTTGLAGDDLKRIHPLGRSPVLTDGKLTIIETTAIMAHLLRHYYDPTRVRLGPRLGERSQESVDVEGWIHFAEASVMLHGVGLFYAIKGGVVTEDGRSAVEAVCARGVRVDLEYLERVLVRNAGRLVSGFEFTAADCAMLYSVDVVRHVLATRSQEWRLNLGLELGVETKKWMDKLFRRRAFQAAVRKEGIPDGRARDWLGAFFDSCSHKNETTTDSSSRSSSSSSSSSRRRRSVFRPCIDLHEGVVKQIVGGTLTDSDSTLKTNFVATHSAAHFASLYREHNLTGGHVIKLGAHNDTAATSAVCAWPRGLHVGGGINLDNAQDWLSKGAEKVIVTSYLFPECKFSVSRLEELSAKVGRQKLVVDVSCRKKGDKWIVAMNRWQDVTDMEVNKHSLDLLANHCSELLIHAADVEGLCEGIDQELVAKLGEWVSIPTTYAGGARHLGDLELVDRLSAGKVDVTFGSALDIFGGTGVTLDELVRWNSCASNP